MSTSFLVRDTWKDTGLECLSMILMFLFRIVAFIVHLSGINYFSFLLQYTFRPKKLMDVIEKSTDDLVVCSWLICCHRVQDNTFKLVSVDDLDVNVFVQNNKNYVCFYTKNPFYLFDLRKAQVDSGYIRRGLLQYVKQFYIIKQKLNLDKNPIIFTGHGASGSIATLFSWFYSMPCQVIVFGAFPIGDAMYCEKLTCDLVEQDIMIHRYNSELDILANFPQQCQVDASPSSFMNYDFPGTTITIQRDETISFTSRLPLNALVYSLPRYYYIAMKNRQTTLLNHITPSTTVYQQ